MTTEQLKDLIRSVGYTTQAQSMEIAQAVEAALTEKQEPEVWFCPDCGTISGTQTRCCPDWIRARKVTKNFAETCKATFQRALHPAPVAEQEPLTHRHEWFRTGAMEPGVFRCIHCGEWNKEAPHPATEAKQGPWCKEMNRCESKCDDCPDTAPVNQQLLSALNAMLTYFGMDEDEWSKPTFDKARAAIAAAEGKV